jgi:hypothetical protein
MRQSVVIAVAAAAGSLLVGGCAQTVEVQTFVLDAHVVAPPRDVPLHVTTPESENTVTISPSFSFGMGGVYTGDVEGSPPSRVSHFYPADTVRGPGGQQQLVRQIPEDNLFWTHPDYSIGLDLNFSGGSVALALGANYASSGGVDFWGWRGGVGFFGQTKSGLGVRLDVGIGWQMVTYDVGSIVVVKETWEPFGQTSVDTAWYRDEGDDARFGYYIALTLNTAGADWIVNGFVQASVARQSLFDFEPSRTVQTVFPMPVVPITVEGGDATTGATLFSLTPGLFTQLTESVRLLAGARVWWEMSGTITSGEPGVYPFIQIDFILPMRSP